MEFSAAVFKNPVQSGRFIGQDWRRFSPWVQYLMPMDYRGHFAGSFETHLDLLAEAIQQQKVWARDFPHLWIGVAAYQLYDEERQPLVRIRSLAAEGKAGDEARQALDRVAERLKTFAPDLHAAITSHLTAPDGSSEFVKRLDAFLADPPAGYYTAAKLTATLDRVRAEGVDGVVVFSTSGLSSAKLWEALGEFFGK